MWNVVGVLWSVAVLIGRSSLVLGITPSEPLPEPSGGGGSGAVHFASAVAVAGNEILIGRPGASARPGSPFSGVHVFRRNAAAKGWVETAVIAPSDVAPGDHFGAALAADGSLLAVGAPQANGARGAVYLFERDAKGRWLQRAKLTSATGAPGERFGEVVALRAGVLLVGAPTTAQAGGRVVVFRRGADAGRWTEQAVLESPDSGTMGFGRAVALADNRAFVGAPESSSLPRRQGPQAAAVFVFRDSAGTWTLETQLTEPADSASALAAASAFGSEFGAALLADGANLWVSNPVRQSGAVFHFRRAGTGQWTNVGRLGTDTPDSRAFGAALAVDGRDLLISAVNFRRDSASGNLLETVAVHVFRYDSATAAWAGARQTLSVAVPPRTPSDQVTPKLAAGGGIIAAGLAWENKHEGSSVVFNRDAAGEWRQVGAVSDTAWNARQPLTGAEVACRRGRAKLFDCQNTDLLSYLPASAIGGEGMGINTVWGWTDSATGREFAVVGRSDGTSFVEVTDPVNPKYLGDLPLHQGASRSLWRDVKVYKNHAFVVSDGAGPHGMQVFDLTQLRDVKTSPATFQETAHYNQVDNVHTIAANEETGFMYLAGGNGGGTVCGGSLHMVDVRNPRQPAFAGCQIGEYVHEAQCVTYHGPDADYRGREICLNASGSKALVLVDVTDKRQPKTISTAKYPNISYTHQGWFTEDQRYFFLNDEYDEGDLKRRAGIDKTRTRTIVFDMSDLDDPVVAKEFYGTTAATDHNMYVRGRYLYQSNYKAGLRVIDVSDPRNPEEVGYFDTFMPFDNSPGTHSGSWANYPFFKSGAIAVTSQGEGLFLVRYRDAAAAPRRSR